LVSNVEDVEQVLMTVVILFVIRSMLFVVLVVRENTNTVVVFGN
jgi:hypothetical protein